MEQKILHKCAWLKKNFPTMNCYLVALSIYHHMGGYGELQYDMNHVVYSAEIDEKLRFFDINGEVTSELEDMLPFRKFYGNYEEKSLLIEICSE